MFIIYSFKSQYHLSGRNEPRASISLHWLRAESFTKCEYNAFSVHSRIHHELVVLTFRTLHGLVWPGLCSNSHPYMFLARDLSHWGKKEINGGKRGLHFSLVLYPELWKVTFFNTGHTGCGILDIIVPKVTFWRKWCVFSLVPFPSCSFLSILCLLNPLF